MNYITTNIRLPEELYMELKLAAVRERISMAHVIRKRLNDTQHTHSQKEQMADKKAQKLIKDMNKLAHRIAKQNKGINLTQALIDMRYEQ